MFLRSARGDTLMCSLRFENNLLSSEGVRFASISKKTLLSKLSFAFISLALPLLFRWLDFVKLICANSFRWSLIWIQTNKGLASCCPTFTHEDKIEHNKRSKNKQKTIIIETNKWRYQATVRVKWRINRDRDSMRLVPIKIRKRKGMYFARL